MHTLFMALEIAGVLFAVVGSVYALVYISDLIETYKWLKKQGRL
jgi:hypothetical protein